MYFYALCDQVNPLIIEKFCSVISSYEAEFLVLYF